MTLLMSVGVVGVNLFLLRPEDLSAFFIIHGCAVLFFFLLNFVLLPFFMLFFGRRRFHNTHGKKIVGEYDVVFTDKGMSLKTPGIQEEVVWSHFDGYDVWKQYVFLYLTNYMGYVIPCASEKEQRELIALFQDKQLTAHP